MERRPDPSTLEYVLRVKKVEVVNCETISQALLFQEELEKWNARMDELEGKKEEEKNE